MAQGDVTVFEEALVYLTNGSWATGDTIKVALVTSGATPTAGLATPALGDFTQVTAGGNYSAGGTSLGTLGSLLSEAAGTLTFDSTTNPSWSQATGNPTNARWGIGYNDTNASDQALFFVDLGSTVNMTAGDLTITWNGSGIFTVS